MRLVEQQLKLTYRAANTLVARFAEIGILRELTQQQRNRRFAYTEYLGMFTDEVLPQPAQIAAGTATTNSQGTAVTQDAGQEPS